jgi:hypothetical protein
MKYALIIGNNKYDDPKLAQLKTPAADSQALAKILDDQTIGSFDEVAPLINKTETQVRRAISAFLINKKPDDLVLLYFSGHGVLDDRGRLYLALKDTQVNLLKATSIPSSFVADEMDSCRSKRQILILDCCHSGAFARGTKGEQKAITETTFEGSGFGRVVLTASDSTQYALEGDQVIKQTELSLFTHFLLEGLRTGEADTNNDGLIALDEWYDYTYTRVISETPRQVPHKWSYNQQGDLIIARNPYVKKKMVELPYELIQALESPFVSVRESAVNELGKYLQSRDPAMVDLAVSSLKTMKEDDSRRISLLAEKLLTEFEEARNLSKVHSSSTMGEMESETADVISEVSTRSPIIAAEIQPAKATPQPVVENLNIPIESPSAYQGVVFDRSFWSKWVGTAIVAVVLLLTFYYYDYSVGVSDTLYVVILFAIVTGSSSLIQWFVFRDRLKVWWIGANTVAGMLLGWLHFYLFGNSGWGKEHLLILFSVWILYNLALGPTLMGEAQEEIFNTSQTPRIKSVTELPETGARQNLFLLLLSTYLVFSALYSLVFALDLYSLQDVSLILGGAAGISAAVVFILKKEVPRNLGFITLAIFLLLDGINIVLYAFISEYPLYLFVLTGIFSLLSGIYFVFRRQILKNLGFLTLSGYLISISFAYYFSMWDFTIHQAFLIISAIFALLSAVFFFSRK